MLTKEDEAAIRTSLESARGPVQDFWRYKVSLFGDDLRTNSLQRECMAHCYRNGIFGLLDIEISCYITHDRGAIRARNLPRDRVILAQIFSCPATTVKAVAERHGISATRVGHIVSRFLRMANHPSRRTLVAKRLRPVSQRHQAYLETLTQMDIEDANV